MGELAAYFSALIGFGTAGGLDFVTTRRGEPLLFYPNKIAAKLGTLFYFLLTIYAFFRFDLWPAVGLVIAALFCMVILSNNLPHGYIPGLVLFAFVIGTAGTIWLFVI